ncbi:MAG: relaxase/mobilization nuclease domain-containing protein [Rhodospirillaceae bacterium]|nr:relaxase/mobilization nuclease domain-containing protein [Rhodospirillales bacterium]
MIAKIVAAKGGGDFARLGRYITDAKKDSLTTAAERLALYVTDAAHDGEKVAWSRITNCGSDDPGMAMLQIRNTQARNTRATNKTLHLVVSFPAGERPSDTQLHQIEDALCVALGMQDHQRLSALHTNTDHVHLHVALNRIHPESLRCVDPSFGQRKLMAACHQLEITLGLTRTNHGLGRDDASQAPIQGRAADMEAHSGVESFARWVRDHARDDLLAAKDQGWPALHQAAAEHGLEIKPRGAGLVFVDATKPGRAVKASSVDRGLSMGALVKACGTFQLAADKVPARETYRAKPLHPHAKASPLYEKYQAQRNAALDQRAKRITSWKHEQRTYRQQLSAWYREEKHKLAHGWLESLALDKGARRRELARQRTTLSERSRGAEKSGIAKIRAEYPLPTWQDWLRRQAAQGDRNAVEVLRSRGDWIHPQPERTGGLPPTSRPTGPATRHNDPAPSAPPYQPWSAALGGEFTYLGQRDPGSGPALVWQQGGIHYAQAATRKAVDAARDIEPGDRVMFHQGRPIIVHSRDTGHGR